MKHKSSYSQEESEQKQIASPEDHGSNINLDLNEAKGHSPTGTNDRLEKVQKIFGSHFRE